MLRVSDLIDLPIYTLMNGNKFKYSVKSLLLDGFSNRIAAIVCKEGTLNKKFLIIPYEKIISVDINGIVVSDVECIVKVAHKDLNKYMQLDAVINKIVRSSSGDFYGILTDIYINPLTGKISNYELSEGYIDDIVNGRKVIEIKNNLNNTVINQEIILYQRLN